MSGSSDKANAEQRHKIQHPISSGPTTATLTAVAGLLGIIIPVILSVGSGLASSVRQCDQDASNLETQLTSILLEIDGREERMKSVLTADPNKVTNEDLVQELIQIEHGAEYDDPQFKDHTLVSLVNQYNRLARRVRVPSGSECYPVDACPIIQLAIDTQSIHPRIETLKISKANPRDFSQNVIHDLAEVQKQQQWHSNYGPERRCSLGLMISDKEPWQLIALVARPEAVSSASTTKEKVTGPSPQE